MASELDAGVDVSEVAGQASRREITAADYDAAYYGAPGTRPKANYCGYGPASQPHWARPLAVWLSLNTERPFLDVGCAFGHLVRELNDLANVHGRESVAQGIEWSDYAYDRTVAERVTITHADARTLNWQDGVFGTVISLDFLEHHTPADTVRCIWEMRRVTRMGGFGVHVIGAANPFEDLSRHTADPTHQNHLSLAWYLEQFGQNGFEPSESLTEDIRQQPAWRDTDWHDRIVVLRRFR